MTISGDASVTPGTGRPVRTWFGHPGGLLVLFLTEMWERFSFYGMRAMLTKFLIAGTALGGFAMSDNEAFQIYSVYNSMVYLMALPGGWVADRLMGTRRSVLWGGIVIALGHYALALLLSPVGLSVTTKLAPLRYASQIMGLWFLATACGNALNRWVARW